MANRAFGASVANASRWALPLNVHCLETHRHGQEHFADIDQRINELRLIDLYKFVNWLKTIWNKLADDN